VLAVLALGVGKAPTFTLAQGEDDDPLGQYFWYTSGIDGSLQPYGVWIPSPYDPNVPHPVVIHLHGYGGRASNSFTSFQANWANAHGWILVNADGRRESTNYDHVGELDLYDAIADLKARGYNVDDDRLYLTGCSMGGHGAYREGFRHPDRWAAVAPAAGWTDYRNFYPQYYEHASNMGRASYFQSPPPYNILAPYYVDPAREPLLETASSLWQVENARWLWIRIGYGTNDTTNPTMNAENVIAKMNEFGYTDRLLVSKVVGGGHCSGYDLTAIYNFFLGKTRVVDPPEVVYTTNSLQYNKAYWVQLDRFLESNKWARLQAKIVEPNTIEVETDYLAQFTLFLNSNLVDMNSPVEVTIDGLGTLMVTPAPSVTFYAVLDGANRVAGWSTDATLPDGLIKERGLSGPIPDAFLSKFLIVYGTSGSAEETAANQRAAYELAAEWNNWLILNWRSGSTVQAGHESDWWVPYGAYPYYYFTSSPAGPVTSTQTIVRPVADTAVTPQQITDYNLILFGEPDDNDLIEQIKDQLPFQLSPGQIQVQDRVYTDQPGKPLDYAFIYPNPLNPERYVMVNRTGLFMDWRNPLTDWGNAYAIGIEFQDLSFSFPDYIIGWRPPNGAYWSETWYEAGYFDGFWQIDDRPPSTLAAFTGTPGDNGWYRSGGTVSLSSGDALGGFGVASVQYSIDGGPWNEYAGPFDVGVESPLAVQYRAVDHNGKVLYGVGLPWEGYPNGPQWLGYESPGNVEEAHVIKIDATPPEIAIAEPQPTEYLHSGSFVLDLSAYDGTSGVASIVADLDGKPVVNGQEIDLFFLTLGEHTLTVTATDYAGNSASAAVVFSVTATIQSTIADTQRAYDEGWIDNRGILNSLLHKLENAQRALDRGNVRVAINMLEAYINELEAQSCSVTAHNCRLESFSARGSHLFYRWLLRRGHRMGHCNGHVTPEAAALLIADAQWVIEYLE
jgi:pimeloyl-ACP methyl ester carboxylesterase